MKKKLMMMMLCMIISVAPLTAYADEKDDRIAELEAQVEELKATIADLEEQLAAGKSTDQEEYEIGDTWVVEGQWKLTVDSVEETDERNEYADQDPAAVYLVTFTYENIGYVDADGIMDGLYFVLDERITDSEKKMGYSYPGDLSMYPQEVPVGASCEAQVCIGVDHPGDFKLYVDQYDGNETEQNAVFHVKVQ